MIFLQSKIQTISRLLNKYYNISNNKSMDKLKNSKIKIFFLVLSGILIGILNGFFGGGGGMICVPLIKKIMNMEDKSAHATTVMIMAITSIPSTIVYILNFGVELTKVVPISLGVLVGGLVGAKVLSMLKNDIINLIFIFVMIAVGIKMYF